jgi:hypothetical protein
MKHVAAAVRGATEYAHPHAVIYRLSRFLIFSARSSPRRRACCMTRTRVTSYIIADRPSNIERYEWMLSLLRSGHDLVEIIKGILERHLPHVVKPCF